MEKGSLEGEFKDDCNITIRNQTGQEIVIRKRDINAESLETKFRLVKIHLEGSDHNVKFPDKETGEFSELTCGVVYTVWGHKWNEKQRFRTPPSPEYLPIDIMMEILKPKLFSSVEHSNLDSEKYYKGFNKTKSVPLLPTNMNDLKVLIIDKKGRQKAYQLDNVTARAIEEEFHVVKTHLEGSDHSAIFPDKLTGKYFKLNASVVYTVYGHPYNRHLIWKPKDGNISARRGSCIELSRSSSNDSLAKESEEDQLLPNQVPEKENNNLTIIPHTDFRESWLKVRQDVKIRNSSSFLYT